MRGLLNGCALDGSDRRSALTAEKVAMSNTRKTADAMAIIDYTVVGDDARLRKMIEQETVNALVAQAIHDARTKAGLTQKELAERIGTKQPVISQLEDADHKGHSLPILRRIATALDQRIKIKLVPMDGDREHGEKRKK